VAPHPARHAGDPKVEISGMWRFIGASNDDDPTTTYASEHFGSVSYFDLAASAKVNKTFTSVVV
jgi:hypothetical protein